MDLNRLQLQQALAVRSAKLAAIDAVPAFQIRYIGDEDACKFTVMGTSGDMTSSVGASGSELSDSNFLESGGATGTWNTGDAYGSQLGMLLDQVAAMADYEIVLLNGLRADGIVGALAALGATQIKTTAGAKVYWDTNLAKHHVLSVTKGRTAFADYSPGNLPSAADIDAGWTNGVLRIYSLMNFSAGAQTIEIHDGATKLWTEPLTSGTAWEKDLHGIPIEGTSGNVLTVKTVNATTSCSGNCEIQYNQLQK